MGSIGHGPVASGSEVVDDGAHHCFLCFFFPFLMDRIDTGVRLFTEVVWLFTRVGRHKGML